MWRIVFYKDEKGISPVYDFLERLSKNERGKMFAWITELKKQGPTLPRPYADLLEDGIHELRIKLKGKQTRTLYFFCFKSYAILTHTFIKTTDEVPRREIEKPENTGRTF